MGRRPESVLERRCDDGVLRFWPSRRWSVLASGIVLAFLAGLVAFLLRLAFDARSEGDHVAFWLVLAMPVAACALGVRVGVWLLTQRRVLTLDLKRGQCSVIRKGLPPPWPVRETAPAVTVALRDVARFIVISRPLIDRFAPPDRRRHGVALDTREGRSHDIGWEFLDDAEAAAMAAEELNRVIGEHDGGA
jgi:hypothetical protein